jgi:hypothetical protein
MFRTILIGATAISASFVISSEGFAQTPTAAHGQMCRSVFTQNKANIETMAGAGDKAGIQALLARTGCSDFGVNIQKPAGGDEKAKPVIKCSITIDPPGINCTITFGMASRPTDVGVARDKTGEAKPPGPSLPAAPRSR